jgi:amino acid adenylation domain-containing protein/FkbM family methyltransferase
VRGAVLAPALWRAARALVARHPALRATFEDRADGPCQRIAAEAGLDWIEIEAAALGGEAAQTQLLSSLAFLPFDLARGPLLRLALVHLPGGAPGDATALVLAVHHIVADFWSLGVLLRELGTLYGRELDRQNPTPALLSPTSAGLAYEELPRREAALLAGPEGERLGELWRQALAGFPLTLSLPTDRPRPSLQTFRGAARPLHLPAPAVAALRRLARRRGATLYMALLAAFQVVLHRHSGQERLLVGCPTTGRGASELAGLVGYLVNPVVITGDLRSDRRAGTGDLRGEELLDRTRRSALFAFAHQAYPFPRLAEELAGEPDPARSPVFQVLFVLQKGRRSGEDALAATAAGEPGTVLACGPLTFEPLPLDEPGAQLELSGVLAEGPRGLAGRLVYNRDLFDATTVERLAGHYLRLLAAIAADPEGTLGAAVVDLPFLSAAERHQLLRDWNDTGAPIPEGCLHEPIAAQAARTPDAIALVFADHSGTAALTYGKLDAEAVRLAERLRRLGVGPETVVGICLERSLALLVGLLGILKAGAAYLPLDPDYPHERLAHMLEDAGAPVVLTERRLAALLPAHAGATLGLDDPVAPAADPGESSSLAPDPDGLAYVIFTSGSTGRPKGAMNTHRAILNRLLWVQEIYPLASGDRVLQKTPISFDVSVWELFWPLLNGACLVLAPPGEQREPARLARTIAAQEVTVLHFVPAMLQAFLDVPEAGGCDSLRAVLASGEALPFAATTRFFERLPGAALYNLYGPTEAAVEVTSWACRPGSGWTIVPLGRPIANTVLHLFDAAFRPVPIGVPGELAIGGVQLARGYRNRPELTAERFVPDPWGEPGGRLYRTGDLVRRLRGGEIEFLGRIDHQVKIRGQRIELGEIEAVLRGQPGVREAVVLVREGPEGDRQLVACLAGEGLDAAGLREALARRLPASMVPLGFALLDALPLLPNGKVDRRALQALPVLTAERPTISARAPGAGPRGPIEEILAGIWCEVLGIEQAGVAESFFALGGHSLLATRVVSRLRELLGVELPVRSLFEAPTIAALAARIIAARKTGEEAPLKILAPIPRWQGEGAPPLSFAQERLWFIDQWEPGSPAYNLPGALRLHGTLDRRVFAAALAEISRRHAALRTVFLAAAEGRPVQVVQAALLSTLPLADLSGLPAESREVESERLRRAEAGRPFDLATGPLLRALLVRLHGDEHLALVTLHHIVADGWSLAILVGELTALYAAFAAGEPSPLADLPLQYGDFAAWQRRELAGPALDSRLAWWRERLAGAPEVLELPTDRPRPLHRSLRGAHLPLVLPAALRAAVQQLGQRSGTTLFMTLLAAYGIVLARSSDVSDLAIGSPIAGRTRREVEGLIGLFVNTLVLRLDLTAGPPGPAFAAILARVRELALGAYEHQDLPFERLVLELRPERHLDHSPLFQVFFALQNTPGGELRLPGIAVAPVRVESGIAKFDLTLAFEEEPAGDLRGRLEYRRDLFDATTAGRLAARFGTLLEAAVADPSRPWTEIPLLPTPERHQVLHEWNDAGPDLAPSRLLPERIAAAMARQPDAVALAQEPAEQLSYGELARRAGRLAGHLRALGVGPESRVGIAVQRSFALVAALLGTWGAGAAYLPLDPDLPAARLSFLLADAGVSVLFTDLDLGAAFPDFHGIQLPVETLWETPPPPSPPSSRLLPEHPAYVMYTSGSTGQPKGVVISHGALAGRLGYALEVEIRPGDRQILKTTISFDASIVALFGPLLAGGTTILARRGGERDPGYLVGLLRDWEVPQVSFNASFLQTLLVECSLEECRNLQAVLTGAEVVPPDLPALFRSRSRADLYNRYGPTEATISVTSWRCRPDEGRPPIGRPIAQARIYLVDPGLRPVPIGVTGEILIAGPILARGYLGRPEWTAERFLPHPFPGSADLPGARVYRTGDLARLRADGAIDFVGRIDSQIKIRGFRVELGEIEAALQEHPAVATAAVVHRETPGMGSGRLLAYLVLRPEASESLDGGAPRDFRDFRDFLAGQLPAYMVPSAFTVLPALPLSPTGKLDRKALPEPAAGEPEILRELPRGPLEELLAGIWSALLGVHPIAREASFFDLGGHSLLATQLTARVRVALGIEIPLRRLFEAPTVAAFASVVAEILAAERPDGALPVAPPLLPAPPRALAEPDLPLSFAQERLWFLDRLEPGNAVYHMPAALRLAGRLEPAVLAASLHEVVRRHEALRTTFAENGSGPVQRIAPVPAVAMPIPEVDLGGLPERDREAELARLAGEESRFPFDLGTGPLLRRTLLRLGREEHVALVTLHHIVADGWSVGILTRELAALYRALAGRAAGPLAGTLLPALPLQYADYALWQRRFLAGETLARQLDWWRGELAGLPPLALPTDRPRPAEGFRGGRGGACLVALPGDTFGDLRILAARRGATLFMTLLAAWQALLARYSGQTALAVGSVVANRSHRELEGLIGFFVNTLAFAGRLHGDPGFGELLGRVRETALAAYAHQDVPFELLVSALAPERDLARTPLDTALALQSGFGSPLVLPGLSLTPLPLPAGAAKFDLTLLLAEGATGIAGELSYRPELFDAPTAARLAGHFRTLLAGAVAEPECPFSTLPLLAAPERQALLEWNATDVRFPAGPGGCLHEGIAVQAARSPDAVALVFLGDAGSEALTYGRLDAAASHLAGRLCRLGVGPEAVVGICLERSLALLVGLLGILKAGGAYLPLDPDYPRERLAHMLEDAGAPVVVTARHLADLLPAHAGTTLFLDEPAADPRAPSPSGISSAPDPDGLAYVLFTSGSTGRPKGAMNTHRAILNRLLWMQEAYGLAPGDRVLQKTPISFDVSVWELFWPLLTGACLVLARPGEHREPARLARTIATQEVTVLHFVPALLQAFLEEPEAVRCGGLRAVMASGEALPFALTERFFQSLPQAALHNLYGPTEAAVDVTAWACRPGSGWTIVPLGRPIANTAIHLLDPSFRPVPIGVPGELLIGGVQLARGYRNRPELTAERFVPDPLGPPGLPGGRLYRTGDLARRLPGGEVEFLGRIDHQVKIRGVRIELGEIEAALSRHPGVQEALVLALPGAARELGDPRLAAFLVPSGKAAPLRHRLRLEREGKLAGIEICELPGGRVVAHRNRGETEFLYREIFDGPGYLRHGLTVADGDTVFDVGANIGLFALFASERARGVRVYAFEPIPEVFAALAANAQIHGWDARLFACGLAEAPGTAELTYYPHATLISGRFADASAEREVVRSFVLGDLGDAGEIEPERLEELLTERLESRQVTCPLRTLSAVIAEEGVERIDLLKIDVEKSELAVLQGLAPEDWAKVRQVVIEVHDEGGRLDLVRALLRGHGFEVAVEEESELHGTGLYNLYARRPALERERTARSATAADPAWESAERLLADVTAALRLHLPESMLPAAFTVLDALPLSPNGKVDRQALARLGATATGGLPRTHSAPASPAERRLAEIWAELLHRNPEEIGREDSFFALGGHSLLAARLLSRLEASLGVVLPLRRVFAAPTLAGLAREVEAAGALPALTSMRLTRRPRPAEIPLSFAQERLWFLDQLEPGSASYNVPLALRLGGALDLPALAASLAGIAGRHETLRTTFAAGSAGPVQAIAPAGAQALPLVDLAGLREGARAEALRLAEAEAARPFDLARGPLFRALLLRLPAEPPEQHLLLLNLHHAVCDGWSLGVLGRELGEFYGALATGRAPKLPELPVQYADYAFWQRERLSGEELARQLAGWRERLAGYPEVLELPTDRPRPAVQSLRGAQVPAALPAGLAGALTALAQSRGATLFMLLLSGLSALLTRLSGQDQVVVGSPVANRAAAALEELIGLFVNVLPLPVDLTADPEGTTLLAAVRETTLAAYAHQELPFEKLVEALSPARSLAHAPLFQVLLALQNVPLPRLDLPGLAVEPQPSASGTEKLDLSWTFHERDGALLGTLSYSTHLFEAATAERLAGWLRTILAGLVDSPERRISEIPLLSAAERRQLRAWSAGPQLPEEDDLFPRGAGLHHLVLAQAARTPAAEALVAGFERLTYGELADRARHLAAVLRGLGVGPEERVGVCLERSPALVVALLGVLAAGGAYVPLDPAYPAERLALMLADSGARVLVSQADLAGRLPSLASLAPLAPIVLLDRAGAPMEGAGDVGGIGDIGDIGDIDVPLDPGEGFAGRLAYLIYTSGSTGTPKGVALTHGSAVALVRWARGVWSDAELSGVLFATSVCFDLSVFELFVPLALGGRVILASDALALPHLPAAEEVTLVNTVPSAMAELVRQGGLPKSVRTVNLAGEALPRPLVEALYALGTVSRVWNLYGPSEDTTYSTAGLQERQEPGAARAPGIPDIPGIGSPVAGTRAAVLDRARRPSPLGVPGELYLGGAGLARGYWNRPELTAERFLPDPSSEQPGERLYRTGDLVRYRADGELEFLGRLDHQVKVRGFRIELGEIEAVLRRQPGVASAVVLAREDRPGDPLLVAYVVPEDGEEGLPDRLRTALAGLLPDYMLPAAFLLLPALPLTPNGKLDRRALPAPDWQGGADHVAPRTALEEVLAGFWREMLGVETIGVRDSFFRLGGHSLLATRLGARVRGAFRVELPLRRLFESPTIEALAAAVTAGEAKPGQSEKIARVLLRVAAGDTTAVQSLRSVRTAPP